MITRMRADLAINSNEFQEISKAACNAGVISDERITLNSSKQFWRLITYVGRRGKEVQFLSNDFDLEPGVVAFLYSRRWDEEKAFDVWKNDWAMGKAWVKSTTSISNQVVLAVITQLLLALFLSKHGMGGASDEKSIKKQAAREAGKDGGTDRPQWSEKVFRFTSRLSRQVLRFFSNCYSKRVTPGLYERQLWPLFERYL